MRSVIFLLLATLALAGCAKPPEQVYTHPKTGQEFLAEHVGECGEIASVFGVINMSPVHQYPMVDMKDRFQREKIFTYCMRKKGYEQGNSIAIIIDENNTRIDIADTLLAAGETSPVTIVFSSAVGGLEVADFIVENGVLSDVKTADAGLTWTALFTPASGLEERNNVVRLNNAGVIDIVSNLGRGITISNNFMIDTLPPRVEIGVTPLSPTVPAEASLPVETGAPTEASIPTGNDVPTEASIPGDSDAPAEASLPFEAESPGLVALPVNFNDEDIYAVNVHQTSRIDFTFSEPPRHFTRSDITVSNGTLGELVRDNKKHYHAIFTAVSDFKGQGQVTVKASRFTDMASNTNPAATPAFVAIDTRLPTITASLESTEGHLR